MPSNQSANIREFSVTSPATTAMAKEEVVVHLEDVSFAYPRQNVYLSATDWILQDISLDIYRGDFLGIIGPNGGGKTTLLRIILGLLEPQKGRVTIFGRPPREIRHQIGYVPQHARIDAGVTATVLDIVLAGRIAHSRWGFHYKKRDRDIAYEALRMTGMVQMADRRISTLSGGQRQRVLIARALTSQPKLLLLDEPTANIDPYVEQNLTDLLHQLNETLPIVVVSHDIGFVSTHLKRVACLHRRLTVHRVSEITQAGMTEFYREQVHMVHHLACCPLQDPGCQHGCQPSAEATSGEESP
ncbi:MAG: metal ABC transporter ATP-binding protein [Thermogutta sp.]